MGQFTCPLCCGRLFSTRQSLKYHILTSESNLSCPECSRGFGSIHELAEHLDLDSCDQAPVLTVHPEESDHNVTQAEHPEEGTHKYEYIVSSPNHDKVETPSGECDDFDECSDSVPTDVADYEVVVTATADVAYDMEGTQNDIREDGADGDEHYCNSCNCKIEDVMEHISEFHPHEMIIFRNADGISDTHQDEYYEVQDPNHDDESFEFSNTEDPINTLSGKSAYSMGSKQNLQASPIDNLMEAAKKMPTSPIKVERNLPRLLSRRKSQHPPPLFIEDLEEEGTCNDSSTTCSKVTPKKKDKIKYPKIQGTTIDKSFQVDPKAGMPYIRKVVSIEKFWESESYKKGLVEGCEESESDSGEKKKAGTSEESSAPSPSKNKASKKKENLHKILNSKSETVPPKLKKPTLLQAHISQLLRSGAFTTLKETLGSSDQHPASNEEILSKLIDAANEHHELKCEGTLNDDNHSLSIKPGPMENDGRESIFKVVSDPTNEKPIHILECSKCKAEFTKEKRFASHVCKVSKVKLETICELCGMKCRSNRTLRAHLESHDPDIKAKKLFRKQVQKLLSKPVTCEYCNTEFTTEGGLKIHQKMHRPDNVQKVAEMNNKIEYRCDLCNMICYSARTFRIHYQVHIGSEPTSVIEEESSPTAAIIPDVVLLTCKLCSESFLSNEELKAHWKNHFQTGLMVCEKTVTEGEVETPVPSEECFTCQECGKCLSVLHRDVHERMHAGEFKFDCHICNKPFTTEENLTLHMTTHQPETEFKCIHCQAKFIDSATLKTHIKTHKSIDRPYPCGFCGRRFSRPHEKVKHERIHTGEKPYECEVCGMRFRVGYCLRMHERIHTGVRPYSCEHCGKTFRARSGYKQHIRLHSDVRAFACPFCPKTFKTVVQLAGHKKSHTKPFTCPDCGRRFATTYMLRAHMNTHSKKIDSLKYRCYICGASYGRDYALKDHIKSHGKNVPPPPEKESEVEIMSDLSNDSNNS